MDFSTGVTHLRRWCSGLLNNNSGIGCRTFFAKDSGQIWSEICFLHNSTDVMKPIIFAFASEDFICSLKLFIQRIQLLKDICKKAHENFIISN